MQRIYVSRLNIFSHYYLSASGHVADANKDDLPTEVMTNQYGVQNVKMVSGRHKSYRQCLLIYMSFVIKGITRKNVQEVIFVVSLS